MIVLGDWVDGNRSGKGLYLFAESGNRYKGIISVVPLFRCILYASFNCYNNKLYFFRGDYLNNKKEGDGIFEWTAGSHAGDRYEGKFQNDVRFVNGFSFNLIDIT